ncbi:unnamed protein product [Closterium sp. NIES-65]|nr:unnamed protein product [Closterium sp. NIES-65]
MAEAVAVMRAKKKAAANGEREGPVLTRSESLLDEKFDAYEAANYRMWARSKSDAFSRRSSTSADESCSDGADGADGADSEDGAEGGEGKATAGGGPLKRSLTEDTTGKTMARGALDGLARSASDVTLQDAEMDEMDREVLQEAFVRVVALQQRVQHYRDLGGFVVLMALFITILYLQADSSRSYEITSAHAVLFPPDASNTFNGPDDFYSWLNTSIVQVRSSAARLCIIAPPAPAVCWPLLRTSKPAPPARLPMPMPHHTSLLPASRPARTRTARPLVSPTSLPLPLFLPHLQTLWADPTCGDGSCDRPFQFPAFGRFGCEADCGTFPNLTSVIIRFSSHLDTQQAADESSWNLCMVDPVSLCWYEAFQPFPRGESEVSVAVDIPDGDWVVVLIAPAGGIRGTVHAPPPGTRRLSVVGAASTIELAAWGSCSLDDGLASTNQTQPGGSAAGASPDICRDTCARLVVCLPATCGRAFTEREVAGAFVDCARMCIVAPSSITSYANASCPTPDIASLFANTPCNVSDALLSLSVAVCPLDMSLALPASACRSLPLRAAPCLCVPLPASACRSLPLRAAPCLCVPLPASACRSLPLRAAPCLCVPLPASACRSLPLRAAPCLCVPLPASACRSLPLRAAPCLCVPLPASACRSLPLRAAPCLCVPLPASACRSLPLRAAPCLCVPLPASACRSLPLRAAPCLCVPLPASACRSLPLRAAPCLCVPLPASACRSLPLRVAPCLCVPLPASACRSLPLRAAPCLCVPLPASACRSLPLRASPCLCVPLPASACRSLPLRAAPCLCVPLPASACRSLPLRAAPCLCVSLPASADTFRDTECLTPPLLARRNPPHYIPLFASHPRLRPSRSYIWWQPSQALQVAVSRALFTVTKDQCLAGHGPGANRKHSQGGPGSLRWNMVACFCTMLGGPVTTLDECRLTDTAGRQVLSISDMYVYLRSTHVRGGRVISAQHMRRFVQTVAAALRSVTLISDAAAARLNTLMHSFDDAIATSDAVGCSQGGAWLPWRAGVKHNTTIHVGDKVTWVWDDDLPHSLKVAAMGEAEDPLFLGFGGNRLVVSRLLTCTHMNVGAGDTVEEPQPCVLSEWGCAHCSSSSHTSHPLTPVILSHQSSSHTSHPLTPVILSHQSSSHTSHPLTPVILSHQSSSHTSHPLTVLHSFLLLPQSLQPGMDDESPGSFAYSKVFYEPLTIHYEDGTLSLDDSSSSSDVSLLTVLPARAGAEVAACCLSTAVGANLNFPFSLQRYGPNYTESNHAFAAERGIAVNRYVSRHNRLLIGMVLQQDRWGTQHCNGSGLLHLAGWCSNGTSLEPFGVNPHFLPTSAIYDSAASANMSQLDNNTFGVKLKFNPQGLPYGFIYPMASLTTLPLVFDINLDYEAAMRRLHYLVDGSYIDNGTRTVDVSFITFNGDSLTFVLTTVTCKVNAGGAMDVSFKSQPAAMAMYDASADNIARLVLEMVYLVGLLWNVCGELQEMADRAATDGYVFSYFGCFWNWVDMLSLTLQVTAVVIWVVLWRYVEAFDMQPRYDIYYTLLEMPRYWAVPNPPTGFISAAQAFADLRNIINLRAVYFALQGINLFFMMTRLLKVMDFQPYLGVITRSLSVATPSLLHFFLLSFTVFFCFSMYGYLVFGGALEMFSSVLESMFSCFLLLLNDNSSAYFFQRLESWDLIAAMLFFFMFIVFMVFILLNFLIAIIVDAFMNVKDSNIVATSITSDLAHIFKYKWNCWRGRYLPYRVILERLVKLGAKDTRVEESNRRMRRMQSMKRRTRAIFSGSCGKTQSAFSTDSESWVRKQHVLTVREKRIDAISLAMILQRRQDRERHEPHEHELLPTCWPKAASRETAEEEQLEQLSQAVMLQCGEVVKQSALPVKKPVQKLSLAHIKEDLARSEAAVKELRGMLALVLDHLARTHPLEDAAHAMGAPADPSAGSSMRRCHTEPAPLSDLLTDSPQPLEPAGSRSEVPRRFSDTGAGGGGVEGQERHGNVRGSLSIARGSASRSLLASKQGSERRVSFKEGTALSRKGPLRTGEEWQQQLPPSNQYRSSDFDSGAFGPPAHLGHRQNSS